MTSRLIKFDSGRKDHQVRIKHALKTPIFNPSLPPDAGLRKPIATASYVRVKGRNAVKPLATDEDFQLTVCCLCPGDHESINRHKNYTIQPTQQAFTVVD